VFNGELTPQGAEGTPLEHLVIQPNQNPVGVQLQFLRCVAEGSMRLVALAPAMKEFGTQILGDADVEPALHLMSAERIGGEDRTELAA
jgi:hypothetical protein